MKSSPPSQAVHGSPSNQMCNFRRGPLVLSEQSQVKSSQVKSSQVKASLPHMQRSGPVASQLIE